MEEFYSRISELDKNGTNISATVVKGQHIGERVLICQNQVTYDSVGSEKSFLAQHFPELIGQPKSALIEVDRESVFVERLEEYKEVVICGGGHVAWPLIQLGKVLGFRVVVLEDRQEFAQICAEKGADQVIEAEFSQGLSQIKGSPNSYFIIVTRGHSFDTVCLKPILEKPAAYIGMMGSKRRAKLVKQSMLEEGYTKQQLERIYTPIGLDILSETPEEIAVSIYAQIIAVKNQRLVSEGYSRPILKKLAQPGPKVLATIVKKQGSAPRDLGTKMIVTPDRSIVGTVGGGRSEADVIDKAVQMLTDGGTEYDYYVVDMTAMTDQEALDFGMVCGGVMEVFLERIE